jgi:large subunit ribosomal protein L19
MSNNLIHTSKVVVEQRKTDLPALRVGSIVSVHYKIQEGTKERIQIYKGIIINMHERTSIQATIKVLRVSARSIKTMRVFSLHSPQVDKIEVHSYQRARRANLNYLINVKDPIKSVRAKKLKEIA